MKSQMNPKIDSKGQITYTAHYNLMTDDMVSGYIYGILCNEYEDDDDWDYYDYDLLNPNDKTYLKFLSDIFRKHPDWLEVLINALTEDLEPDHEEEMNEERKEVYLKALRYILDECKDHEPELLKEFMSYLKIE